jgi:hypothetical protein
MKFISPFSSKIVFSINFLTLNCFLVCKEIENKFLASTVPGRSFKPRPWGTGSA